jgi:hypothetical protein
LSVIVVPMKPELPCMLDIEASGFGRNSYPIEIGYVCSDGSAWCTLVRPPDDWTHWDASAEQVHHIARNTLLAHGRPPLEVARQLNAALAGRTVYCDGWAHDYTWLGVLFEAAGLQPQFKLASVRQLLDEAQLSRLDALRRGSFSVLGIARHRASSDARALQWAVGKLLGAVAQTAADAQPDNTAGPPAAAAPLAPAGHTDQRR